MGAPKRKAPTMKAKQAETVNKKGLIVAGSIVGVIVVAMALLLLFT